MRKLIEQFKNQRKRIYIKTTNTKKYAFIGMGTHSIYNLYPLINYFRLDLKYIVTKSTTNAALIDKNFPHSIGTNDLEEVLNDSEISGIFISTNPSSHYNLLKKCLISGKNVFVEKPPCFSLKELETLIELEKESKGTCLVGLQKQYAPCNLKLKKELGEKCSYNYRFITGPYPEGDPLLDLFIHPITLTNFLFGAIEHENIMIQKTKEAITVFLHLQHKNGTRGTVELSTNYSWRTPIEKLIVNSEKGIYEMNNTEDLSLELKAGTILGIPKEKIFRNKHEMIYLIKRDNFTPTINNNQLYSSGYFNEIKSFIDTCESKKSKNNSTLSSCRGAYIIIFKIKEKYNV